MARTKIEAKQNVIIGSLSRVRFSFDNQKSNEIRTVKYFQIRAKKGSALKSIQLCI